MILAELQAGLRSWLQVGAADLPPPGFDLAALPGLRVYKNNYRTQLLDCLELSFPCTLAWIGEEAFGAAAEDHVHAVAPSSWTIDAYAAGFPATLAQIYNHDDEVAELAWLEWALGECFVGRDQSPVSPGDLADINWDRASLRLQSSMLVRDARTNAGAICSALTTGGLPPPAAGVPPGSSYLVWRSGFEARFRTIAEAEARAVRAVLEGTTFADVCAHLVAREGEEQGTKMAGELLGGWLAEGLVVEVIETE